jgi:similar to stage IV sporulation protein
MLIKLLRYLLGYVNFTVKGDYPERLLNQLGFKGVSVWNMHRCNDILTASMKASDYKKMLSLRGKNRVFTRVTERKGLPFTLKKYRYRVGFVFGIALYFAIIIFLSNFVWNIEIVGTDRLDNQKILQALEKFGVKEGIEISSIDQQTLPSLLALEIDGIAWCSVNVEGVKVTVNISESAVTERFDNTPGNLVAKCDGIITKIEVLNGTTAVTLGQTVKKGDLLVSGFTEYKDGSSTFGPSLGKIIAKTERNLQVFSPFNIERIVETGEPLQKSVISFFGLNIPLYLGQFKGQYHVSTETKKLQHNGMYIPVFLKTATFTPTQTVSVTLSTEEATEIAKKMLEELEKKELLDAEIVSKELSFDVTDKGVVLNAKYICRENIAEQDLLLIY